MDITCHNMPSCVSSASVYGRCSKENKRWEGRCWSFWWSWRSDQLWVGFCASHSNIVAPFWMFFTDFFWDTVQRFRFYSAHETIRLNLQRVLARMERLPCSGRMGLTSGKFSHSPLRSKYPWFYHSKCWTCRVLRARIGKRIEFGNSWSSILKISVSSFDDAEQLPFWSGPGAASGAGESIPWELRCVADPELRGGVEQHVKPCWCFFQCLR